MKLTIIGVLLFVLYALFIHNPASAQAPELFTVEQPLWVAEFRELPQELQDIAWCESRLQVDAQNKISSASGLFQFIDGSARWVHYEMYGIPLHMEYKDDPLLQVRMAKWLYENHGPQHWECWTKNMV